MPNAVQPILTSVALSHIPCCLPLHSSFRGGARGFGGGGKAGGQRGGRGGERALLCNRL